MTPRTSALLAATAWLVSLAAAGMVGWQLAPRSGTRGRPAQDVAEPVRASPLHEEDMRRLRDENAALRDALRRDQGELQDRSIDRRGPAPAGREAAAARSIGYYLERYFAARQEGTLFSELDEGVALALRVALAGREGVEEMAERARNAESVEERLLSLDVLSMVADPVALKTIVEYPWDEVAGELGSSGMPTWDWTMVERHLEELPSSAITPYSETFENRLKEERAEFAGELSDEGLRACTQLALRHGSPGALSLLKQVWPELAPQQKSSVIDSLVFIETRGSLDFLGDVAAHDESEAARERADGARRILAEHLGGAGGR